MPRRWRAGGGGGGGDSLAGVGSGGTGSFASGPIRGSGPIIVGGVRYDDSAARIATDAGATASSADLRLGMMVEVNGGDIATDALTGQRRAAASTISVRSEVEGPIQSIDLASGTLAVLGQQVRVTPTTVFDDDLRGGLASLHVGQVVEIYGLLTAAGQYTATRIDDEDDARHYKLRGPVSGLDTTARTLRIGTATVSYAGLGTPPAGLANGQYARVELALTPSPTGVWTATRLQTTPTGTGSLPTTGRMNAELEGYITAFTSSTRFAVNGVDVDAGSTARLPAGLALGRRVEVEGMLVNGTLVAHEVELEDDNDRDDDGLEIEGRITSVAAGSFVVRGVTVGYNAATRFKDGTPAQLTVGVKVEVQGNLSPDGATLLATEIEFDD
ncbi:MAG: hypothetical protein E6Q94_09945 [Burkholderiaceae bacterium]|nr:MAG: hypothetical protein E6Q94_09945 [Burkholderiaceae bacterium]